MGLESIGDIIPQNIRIKSRIDLNNPTETLPSQTPRFFKDKYVPESYTKGDGIHVPLIRTLGNLHLPVQPDCFQRKYIGQNSWGGSVEAIVSTYTPYHDTAKTTYLNIGERLMQVYDCVRIEMPDNSIIDVSPLGWDTGLPEKINGKWTQPYHGEGLAIWMQGQLCVLNFEKQYSYFELTKAFYDEMNGSIVILAEYQNGDGLKSEERIDILIYNNGTNRDTDLYSI